jgi:hypothetical protein
MNTLEGYATEEKFGTIESACRRYGFGRNKMRKIASDAKAVIKIGRCVRVNYAAVDHYFEMLSGE